MLSSFLKGSFSRFAYYELSETRISSQLHQLVLQTRDDPRKVLVNILQSTIFLKRTVRISKIPLNSWTEILCVLRMNYSNLIRWPFSLSEQFALDLIKVTEAGEIVKS